MGVLSKLVPDKEGGYWHWCGDKDEKPTVANVFWSEGRKEFCVPLIRKGSVNMVSCKDHGGWWKMIDMPLVPLETLDHPCPICEKEECLPREDWCAHCCEEFYENVQG